MTFRAAPSARDLDDLRAAGAELPLDRQGRPLGGGRFVTARMSPAALRAAAGLVQVERIHLDGSPFGHPQPLDGTVAEVHAPSVWQSRDTLGLPIAGQGMTVCDIDGGVDVFHPMFFRADGGYVLWIDVDESGAFTPGVDGVSPLGDGTVVTLRVLDGLVTHYFNDTPEADGADVRQAIQQGALADEQVGSAPNHDWGYGKLRIYRSIYGSDPAGGGAPTIQPLVATVTIGELETLTVAVDDPDEPVEALLLELDRDYDGLYDEQLAGASFEVLLDEPATMVAKLRATDSTGREAVALATITAVEELPLHPVLPPEEVVRTLVPAGGCACTTRASQPARTAWLALLAPLLVLGRRPRRRPSATH